MLAKKRDKDKKGAHIIVVIEEKELSNEGYATITSNLIGSYPNIYKNSLLEILGLTKQV